MRVEPIVSLIQPLHNQQAWLTRQSEALLEELADWERSFSLVFVDDGSQDGTPELLDELRRRYPQVCVHRHPRQLGVEACIQSGIPKAAGEVLLVRDSYQGVSRGLLGRLWPMIDDPKVLAAQCRQRSWNWEPTGGDEGDSATVDGQADPAQAALCRMLNWLGWGLAAPAERSDKADPTRVAGGHPQLLRAAAEEAAGLRLLRRPARTDSFGQAVPPPAGGLVWEHAADRRLSVRTDQPNRKVPSPASNSARGAAALQ